MLYTTKDIQVNRDSHHIAYPTYGAFITVKQHYKTLK